MEVRGGRGGWDERGRRREVGVVCRGGMLESALYQLGSEVRAATPHLSYCAQVPHLSDE